MRLDFSYNTPHTQPERAEIIIKLIKKLLRKTRSRQAPLQASYVIPRNQHTVSKTDISPNALNVLNKINKAGFQAYLVGGSIRDLLLGKIPKDFDIATDATPNQVRNLFRNSCIIGRRFKLVHIMFHREIIEVATFRGSESHEDLHKTNEKGMVIRDNVYGTVDEDAWRRDFTVNSLYYNIRDSSIIDFTGGFKDLHSRILRILGSASQRYQEDPVRMLRAIRFTAKLHFELCPETASPMQELNHLITHVSSSRLFDEITKLYHCGEAIRVQDLMIQYGLFQLLFKQTHVLMDSSFPVNAFLIAALESTDSRLKENKPVTPAFLIAVFLWFPLQACAQRLQTEEEIPPLPALEQAMSIVLMEQSKVVLVPKRFGQVIREIWLLQFRFDKRQGQRAFNLISHPRFRAAYDFLALRALSGDASIELADWWTQFQEVDEDKRMEMVKALKPAINKRKKAKKKPPVHVENPQS